MIGAPAFKPILPYVLICSQAWTKKNLDVDQYRNGDPIPQVTDAVQWAGLTSGAWCWYNNDSATYAAIYGRLYNWYAINDPRQLAPEGWYIPSNADGAPWSTAVQEVPATLSRQRGPITGPHQTLVQPTAPALMHWVPDTGVLIGHS
ncbi:MAG: fibrobacter succinogenes major paralogous domain-containing protein [Chitinophagaceae bacterium]|nr:fibrobacter succinogenes major paralogous domain-containing protein [Chitinophagaceae bacterium]